MRTLSGLVQGIVISTFVSSTVLADDTTAGSNANQHKHVSVAKSKHAGQSAHILEGEWTYRSFRDDPDRSKPANDLLFGTGDLTISSVGNGRLAGRLSFGPQQQLALKGWVTFGNPPALRFQGVGDKSGSKDWVYDYRGHYVLEWPNGVNQRAAIVGSIVRTQPHSNGAAKAGVVASWIAVKKDDRLAPPVATAKQQHEAMAKLKISWTKFFDSPVAFSAPKNTPPQRLELAMASTAAFPEPDVVRSVNAVLSTELVVDYASNTIGADPVLLRSYNGSG
ncbi:MAG: hypothetical protein O3A00_22150 [Planctomycetota bacterium]|nr:hypothetical protein [Planctomycetota bacterium]